MALSVDNLAGLLQKGFARAAITTESGLKDDERVRSAARKMYDFLPFPVKIAIKMSVGIEGLERFALVFRDKLLAAGITDLSKLSPDDLRAIMQKSVASVPKLSQILTRGGNGKLSDQKDAQPQIGMSTAAPSEVANDALNGYAAPRQLNEAKNWYLLRGETKYGPWSDKEFLSIAEKGGLGLNDMVWRKGFQNWVVLREFPGLLPRQ